MIGASESCSLEFFIRVKVARSGLSHPVSQMRRAYAFLCRDCEYHNARLPPKLHLLGMSLDTDAIEYKRGGGGLTTNNKVIRINSLRKFGN